MKSYQNRMSIGVIPARGGSKSVPRKNLAPVLGKPLVAYTIEAALQSNFLTRVVLSTEDEEIAAIGREYGAEVPFLRPEELAGDEVPSLPVVQHAIREMEHRDGREYDVVLLLQPTSPLRTADEIDQGIRMLVESGADTIVGVMDVGGYHPFRMKRLLDDGRLINYIDQGFEDMRPRQVLPKVYKRSGSGYVSWRSVVMEQDTLVGKHCRAYTVPDESAIDIDSEADILVAEYLLSRRRGDE